MPEVEKHVKERTGHSVRFIKAWAGTIAKPDAIIDAVGKGSLIDREAEELHDTLNTTTRPLNE